MSKPGADTPTLLYLGGDFTTAGNVPANFLERHQLHWAWIRDQWPDIFDMVFNTSGNLLIVAGDFSTAGSLPANFISTWDPQVGKWGYLSLSQPNGHVNALAFDSSDTLYVGGSFSAIGPLHASNVAKFAGVIRFRGCCRITRMRFMPREISSTVGRIMSRISGGYHFRAQVGEWQWLGFISPQPRFRFLLKCCRCLWPGNLRALGSRKSPDTTWRHSNRWLMATASTTTPTAAAGTRSTSGSSTLAGSFGAPHTEKLSAITSRGGTGPISCRWQAATVWQVWQVWQTVSINRC